MLQLTPFLLMLAYGLLAYWFSAYRTARELDARSTPLTDPELRRQTDRLAIALGVPQVKVFVYEIEPVNGLAAADGRIFLTRGFYQKFRDGLVTAEELASVIAHELGHVALGHARRRVVDFSGQNAMRMVLAAVLNRVLPGVGALIANGLASLLAARLSRQDEFEADAYAAALMTKAGLGTAPQISLLRKLALLTGGNATGPAWLLSHPETGQRIDAVEKLQARWANPPDRPPTRL